MAYQGETGTAVTGYFERRSEAQAAVEALKEAGFKHSNISLAVRPEYGSGESSAYETGRSAGQKTESMWGKVVDFFEGKNQDEASRERDAGQTSGMRDGVTGEQGNGGYDYNYNDFQGSLEGVNVPEHHAKYFSHHFSQGEEGALVTVTAEGRASEAEAILERYKGDVGRNAESFQYPANGAEGLNTQGSQRVQLLGEILRVHKDRVQRGEVVLRKEVVTETQTIQVPVEREELVITRRAVDGDGSRDVAGNIGDQKEIRIPLSEERVHMSKENVVREEISVGTREVTGSETVSDEVRHEELRMDETGAVGDKERVRSGGR